MYCKLYKGCQGMLYSYNVAYRNIVGIHTQSIHDVFKRAVKLG